MSQTCDSCQVKLTNWDYRYWGKHFCRMCYDQSFKLRECSVCHKRKMIFNELETPICKTCQLINLPCIRCHKIKYTPGKVTEDGPVCNSCSKYFREPKECQRCHKKTIDTSNRTMEDGEVEKICASCYRKTLSVCFKCHKQRKAFAVTLDQRKPICKICSQEDTRICTQCNKVFPAGMGRICKECAYSNTLDKKVRFAKDALSHYMSEYFVKFSGWLRDRRGIEFTAMRVDQYFPYFLELDKLSQTLEYIPNYKEIVETLSVAKTRKNLLVTLFFEEIGLIRVDREIKEEYANWDMIERYLLSFDEDGFSYKVLKEYLSRLVKKLTDNKTTVRSIRLAITPVSKLLLYSENFQSIYPTQDALDGYLWCYPGQRSSITGFINFLRSEYSIALDVKNLGDITLSRPRESHQYLKQKFIDSLRQHEIGNTNKAIFLKNAVEYLHEVRIPSNIFLSKKMIKKNKRKEAYLHVANQRFFLPLEVIKKL